MERITILRLLVLLLLLAAHVVFTLRFTLAFKKNVVFSKKLKAFHVIMAWIIPFVWVVLLNSLMKDIPGSWQIENKSDSDTGAAKTTYPWEN